MGVFWFGKKSGGSNLKAGKNININKDAINVNDNINVTSINDNYNFTNENNGIVRFNDLNNYEKKYSSFDDIKREPSEISKNQAVVNFAEFRQKDVLIEIYFTTIKGEFRCHFMHYAWWGKKTSFVYFNGILVDESFKSNDGTKETEITTVESLQDILMITTEDDILKVSFYFNTPK